MTEPNDPTLVRFELAVTLLTPLCVGAAGSSGGLADKTLLRDGWNRPIIPGSQLKGRVRHACERIAEALGEPVCAAPYGERMCPDGPGAVTRRAREPLDLARAGGAGAQCVVCALFGSPTYRSPLAFDDLVFTPVAARPKPDAPFPRQERLRPGVALDRRRRVAHEEVLYLVETVEAGAVFRGAIHGRWRATPPAEVRRLAGLLAAGLMTTTRWGGGSSRGLGWAKVEVTGLTLGDERLAAADLIEEVPQLCAVE